MKVVIRMPNWLGDVIMARPAVDAVAGAVAKTSTTDGDSVVLVARPSVIAACDAACVAACVAAGAAAGARYTVCEAPHGTDADIFKRIAPDRIILLTHSFGTALAAWRAGIPERIGEARHGRGFFLTTPVKPLSGRPHQIEEYSHLARAAGYAVADTPPTLPARERGVVTPPYVVLAPGARYGSAKRWPGFASLAARFAKEGHNVVVLGAAGEEIGGGELLLTTGPAKPGQSPRGDTRVWERELLPHACVPPRTPPIAFDFNGNYRTKLRSSGGEARIHNLVGHTSLSDALDIVAHADFVVSNDSGLAHAARALGRPTIVLFGPTDPERTAPRGALVIRGDAECAPCLLRTCPIDHRCLIELSVERVHAAAVNLQSTNRTFAHPKPVRE